MGNSSSFNFQYSVEVEPSTNPQQTGTYRSSTHPDELIEGFTDIEVNNCWDLFQLGRQANPSGNCLGRRIRRADGSLGHYTWLTFNEVNDMALRLGSAMMDNNIVPLTQFPKEEFEGAREMRQLGIFAKNRVEWFVCEQAANAFGVTVVPLYDTLGDLAVRFILDQTKMGAVACGGESVAFLLKVAGNSTSLQHIITFDEIPEELQAQAKENGITLHSFETLAEYKTMRAPTPGNRSTVATLCYTSGTTGDPKGVILTHGNFVSCIIAAIRGPLGYSNGFDVSPADVHISYLPLAHVFERIICGVVVAKGAAIGVFSGDTQKLLEDVRELEPTIFISVPRLFNRINDKVFGGIKEKSAVAQYLFNSGVATKLKNLRSEATVTHTFWDALVFNKIKQLMGGRLRYMLAGGAPIDAVIQERMKVLFCAPMAEGYGLTETLGASFITSPKDPLSGHVGGCVPCLEFRLESVPEMEYEVTSEPRRGELLIRGNALCKGYFGNPEETQKAIDKDGWLHTGDIVVLLPNGGVKIIDRKKNIFKLAQGEYVAPEKIEGVYQQALLVSQVFAFGYSSKFVLVGIVVPDAEIAEKWAIKNKVKDTSLDALCKNVEFKKAVVQDMEKIAKEGNLKGFEKLKEIHLTPDQFTTENGLLTPTFKLKRYFAKRYFEEQIDAMYSQLGQ